MSSLLKENFIISKNDIVYNFDKFKSGDINLLLIVGFSGSGKTTSAFQIEKDLKNCYIISLDLILNNKNDIINDKSNNYSIFKTFFNQNEELLTLDIDNNRKNRILYIEKFIKFIEDYAENNKNVQFIVEGIWPVSYEFDPKLFDNWAVIIKGTSYIKSDFRVSKRETSNNKDAVFDFLKAQNLIRLININKLNKNIELWRKHFKNLMI